MSSHMLQGRTAAKIYNGQLASFWAVMIKVFVFHCVTKKPDTVSFVIGNTTAIDLSFKNI
jgi:hypothetical protein